VADDDCGNNVRKRERGEEGQGRRDQDRCNTQNLGGGGAPIDVGTGGVRGSDERGDRTAEERQKRVQTKSEVTNDRGACMHMCECKQERQEVKHDRLGC
jgi:hypothetical protein